MFIKTALVLSLFVTVAVCNYTCPSGWVSILYRCYSFNTAPIADWYLARKACEDATGHLISIESPLERDNIRNYIKSSGATSAVGWWTSGRWTMLDAFAWQGTGRDLKFTDFCNGNATADRNNRCFILDPTCNYSWKVVSCNTANYYYICEKDITKT